MPDDSIEQWRAVYDDAGHYEVSDHGRVRRTIANPWYPAGYILKPQLGERGYLYVNLTPAKGSRGRAFKVHRLVTLAFVGPPPTPSHTVNHKDGNKLNNTPSNLEWMTRREQSQHALRLGLLDGRYLGVRHKGEANVRAKLTASRVRIIRELAAVGIPGKDMARMAQVDSSTVYAILSGRSWTHIS